MLARAFLRRRQLECAVARLLKNHRLYVFLFNKNTYILIISYIYIKGNILFLE